MATDCVERRSGTARSRLPLWAYLSDPMPTGGPENLFAQKKVVDCLAGNTARYIERYVVDSGSMLTEYGVGARLKKFIDEARLTGRAGTLLVASAGCLASTRRARHVVLASLLAADIAVEDRSGALGPSPRTTALAVTAARRRSQRKHADIAGHIDV